MSFAAALQLLTKLEELTGAPDGSYCGVSPVAYRAWKGDGTAWKPAPKQAQIAYAAREADNDRANGRYHGLAALLLFCLPLVWYFLRDRVREASDAISGRDRR
ncbi:MAG: hypothetical protein WA005_17630 [Candidatus Binataceae bacterium]